MSPRHALRGRTSAAASVVLVSLATVATLAGCSSRRSHEILGPTRSSVERVAGSEPSVVLAPPPLIDRWKSPRIRVWTDGWRNVQKEGGVSLEPSLIWGLEVPEPQPVTFQWSARPRSGQGEIVAYRWAVDMPDITDETPRLDAGDLAHWSAWSATETSTTVGPYADGPHLFYLMARDNIGFVSMVRIRLQVAGAEALPLTRR